jgi:signal transduction histidine kinase
MTAAPWQPARAFLRGHPALADGALVGALFLGEAVLWLLGPREFWPRSWPLALLWSGLGLAILALRRRATWLAVALLAAHTVASFIHPALSVEGIAIIVLTYTAGAYLPLRQAVLATDLLWVPAILLATTAFDTTRPPLRLGPWYFALVCLLGALVCLLIGRTTHHRRAYISALEGRAHDAERNQRAHAERAVADERRRIARELHDMVAHHVSVMGVLAAGTRRTLMRDPATADEALATIEETGRTALREMRRLLDVLRTDQEPAGELAPQPGLPHLAGLAEQVREAGLPVTLTIDGEPGALDAGVALTVYRIVQEALTNALKHAGAAKADVRIDIGTYWLTLEICDTGRGPRPGGGPVGHGLLGMRERVVLYGGTLLIGPRPGGGFRVSARIPVDVAEAGG